ncbi:hypothetical protein C8T65DRAFT_651263 [Cerioporus squamosus]|nr:hypothetical protein C8T65DRAFT_651263 [Cerioporus squamosus]
MPDLAPSSEPKAFDIYMSGYLLTLDMIARLCVLAYGATPAIVKNMGPLDTASCYYSLRRTIDAPTLIRIPYKDKAQGGKVVDRWILPGKVVFFPPRTTPPPLSFDDETRAYLNTWLPPDILHTEAFKDIRFVTRLWPRGERRTYPTPLKLPIVLLTLPLATGIVLHAVRMHNEEYRELHRQAQQAWLERTRGRGHEDMEIPPAFPFEWKV